MAVSKKRDNLVMVYVPLVGGAPIIAKEIKRIDGKIQVEHPAHVQLSQDQTHFTFSSLQFLSECPRVYESGLVAEGVAHAHMTKDYLTWVSKKKAE